MKPLLKRFWLAARFVANSTCGKMGLSIVLEGSPPTGIREADAGSPTGRVQPHLVADVSATAH